MPEKLLTINIRKYLVTQPRVKRHRKAAAFIREAVAHYTKTDLDKVRLDPSLNTLIFKSHYRSMLPIKVTVTMDNGIAKVKPLSDKAAAQPEKTKKEEKNDKKKAKEAPAQKPKRPDATKAKENGAENKPK
ncbi:MAG: hypothetical protein LVQ97_02615 [Candidatus Micrarchaeales archaeon]|jgi:hypothetical protein|uniref:Large ribosomal subunit protein eL31 n=1 Tax=Candidatus Micrarchaeum acidiphilum ARMAN-2 TaxID=425595 RepID=C7DIM4_MICA2|nr:MAG: hypothetical protein UNLARM2_0912 [Candidatus Micrarchaeum acidiphilum ARMAN-2]MCW6161054.1 hypothetical protein [Candidatus Micrarchaeales archaeon]